MAKSVNKAVSEIEKAIQRSVKGLTDHQFVECLEHAIEQLEFQLTAKEEELERDERQAESDYADQSQW